MRVIIIGGGILGAACAYALREHEVTTLDAGLHVSVMHSGVTLAAIVAEIMAAELQGQTISNLHADLVATYRPARFQSAIS